MDKNDLNQRNIDYIVYQKPARFQSQLSHDKLDNCDSKIENLYGAPIFEDELIKVFNPK